jgi:hypothetical protein
MALQIFQITFPTASVTTESFFRKLAADLIITAGAPVIDLNDVDEPFDNDAGASPVTVPAVAPNGYYNLYIDGVKQESGSYVVDAALATITFNVAISTTFLADTIIILEAVIVTTA